MRTWIFLISTSIHGFLQNLPVQARGRSPSPGQSLSLLLHTMFYPKGKFESAANTMALIMQ